MKDYDETIKTVFDRIDGFEKEKKKRRTAALRFAAAAGCFCIIAGAAFGVWKTAGNTVPVTADTGPGITENAGKDKTGDNGTGEKPLPKESVTSASETAQTEVHVDVIDALTGEPVEWNGKKVSPALCSVLMSLLEREKVNVRPVFAYTQETAYSADGTDDIQQTILERRNLLDRHYMLLKTGDSLKYGEALYTTGTPDGEKWAEQLYLKTVGQIGEDILTKYIRDGEFFRQELEDDISALQERLNQADKELAEAMSEEQKARDEYFRSVVAVAAAALEKQGVTYMEYDLRERRPENSLVICVTAGELASLNLDNVLFYAEDNLDGFGTYVTDAEEAVLD